MKTMMQYAIEMLLCSGIFMTAYVTLLRKATDYRLRRGYIIICTIIAAVIPFIEIPILPADTVIIEVPVISAGEPLDVAHLIPERAA